MLPSDSFRSRTLGAFLVLAAALCFARPLTATTIAGGNVINQTWTPAGSPYIVQGDVTVPSGAFLSIQAGTTVQFASTDGQVAGLDTARVELTIKGTLTVAGTVANPVLLLAEVGSGPAIWYGIVVDTTATSAVVANAVVQNAVYGIYNLAPGAVLSVSATTLTANSQAGIAVAAGFPVLDGLIASGNTNGVLVTGGSPTISNSRLVSNSYAGLWTRAASGVTTVAYATIHGNTNYGVRVEGGAGAKTTTIKNSIVTVQAYGVYRADASTVSVTYSDVWGNASGNYSSVTAGTGCLSSNPLYVSAPANLRLTSNSPARFASDVGTDIGALPYVSDATPGLYGVLWSNLELALPASPAVLAGDLTIAAGVTLTVDPGVTLSWASSDIMASGADTSRGELLVAGTLLAQGSAASPIVLSCVNPASNCWRGVTLGAGSAGSTLRHVTVEYGYDGLLLSSTGTHTIGNLRTRNHGHAGVAVSAGTPLLDGVSASGSPYGIHVSGTASPAIVNAVLQSNTVAALAVVSTGGITTLDSSTVQGNPADGVLVAGSSLESVVVRSAIVASNGTGVRRNDSSAVSVLYSDVWGNTNNFSGVSPGAGVVSANPLLVSPPTDLHIQAGSVAIDAGFVTGPNHDLDGNPRPLDGDGVNGAQFDMGAYEFVPPNADLSITKSDGQTSAVPGQPVTYTIVATNAGFTALAGAAVADTLPTALLGATWTCTASAGSSCSASGSGSINDGVSLLAGGAVTYTLSATVDPAAAGSLANTATVTPPGGVIDPAPGKQLRHGHRQPDPSGGPVDHEDGRPDAAVARVADHIHDRGVERGAERRDRGDGGGRGADDDH